MDPFKRFAKKFPWLFALLGIVLLWACVNVTKRLLGIEEMTSPDKELWTGICELIATVIIFAVFGLFVGFKRLKFSGKGMKYGLRFMWLQLAIMALITVGSLVAGRSNIRFEWKKVAGYALLFTVGIVEEFTCRGMLFGGLLKCFDKSHRGIILAAVISGVLFGFVHVFGNVMRGEMTDATAVAQAAGKTVEAGMFGFIMAAVYLKTRNIWVTTVLHSAFDGFGFVTLCLMSNMDENKLQYVRTGEQGKYGIVQYLIMIAIMLPFAIKAVKDIKKTALPCPCPLDDSWYADTEEAAPAAD